MSQQVAYKVRITGRVQGVGYRAWTVGQAKRRNISGWVRNRLDGSVEAVFKGEPRAVEELLSKCLEGPMVAAVNQIFKEPLEEEVEQGFHQLPTTD